MRDWREIDKHYSELLADIYPQPEDPEDGEHQVFTKHVIRNWVGNLTAKNVLDVGCGQGFAQPYFEKIGLKYVGITLGSDYGEALEKGRNVLKMDFHFLDFNDESFDLIYSRHSLEHSPMPLLALMEWYRVSRAWLCLVLPNPAHYSWTMPNHYGIMTKALAVTLLERAGWRVIWQDEAPTEFRWMCEKKVKHYTEEERFALYEDHSDG